MSAPRTTISIPWEERDRWTPVAHDHGMSLSVAIREGARQFLEGEPPAQICAQCKGPARIQDADPEIDPALGHWFAGFVDGEGCFRIAANNGGRSMCCRFTLKLRHDDAPILDELCRTLGIGQVGRDLGPSRRPSKPSARWQVYDRAGCEKLVAIFDRYPLRAKKARDYAIWREAVHEWAVVGGPRSGYAGPAQWDRMNELARLLDDTRRYVGPERRQIA